jgi:hypothetical protein
LIETNGPAKALQGGGDSQQFAVQDRAHLLSVFANSSSVIDNLLEILNPQFQSFQAQSAFLNFEIVMTWNPPVENPFGSV